MSTQINALKTEIVRSYKGPGWGVGCFITNLHVALGWTCKSQDMLEDVLSRTSPI
jgi:hypothetical protein